MAVRIGYGCGTRDLGTTLDPARLAALVGALERHGLDSLWLSERLTADVVDPVVGLTFAAALTRRIKLGTSVMVLPGRNPVLVAKQLASIDRLSGGRFLPAFELGAPLAVEHEAFGVAPGERAAWLEEALPLLRRLWAEDAVDHDGPRFHLHGVEVRPKPLRHGLDVWLGGRSRRELERIGRMADGWLASFSTPEEVRRGRAVIEEAAERAGREVDPGHIGAIVLYAREPLTDAHRHILAAARRSAPAVEPADLVGSDGAGIRRLLERHVESGATKFVLMPLHRAGDWDEEIAWVAGEVLRLQGAGPVPGGRSTRD